MYVPLRMANNALNDSKRMLFWDKNVSNVPHRLGHEELEQAGEDSTVVRVALIWNCDGASLQYSGMPRFVCPSLQLIKYSMARALL